MDVGCKRPKGALTAVGSTHCLAKFCWRQECMWGCGGVRRPCGAQSRSVSDPARLYNTVEKMQQDGSR